MAYARTVMVRILISHSKAAGPRKILRDEHRGDEIDTASIQADGSGLTIVDRIVIWDEIGRLPPITRAAIVMRIYLEYTYAQIAAILDYPESTCRSLVYRARTELRKRLTDDSSERR